jgi:hypothetical protein
VHSQHRKDISLAQQELCISVLYIHDNPSRLENPSDEVLPTYRQVESSSQ